MHKFTVLGLATLLIALPLSACGAEEDAVQTDDDLAEEVLPYSVREEETEQTENPEEPEEENNAENTAEAEETETVTPVCTATYVVVGVDGLNVRTGAGTSYRSLGQADKNVLLSYCGTENGWYCTYYCGSAAYVSAQSAYTSLTALAAGDDRVEAVVNEGVKLLGIAYVYGAVRLHDGTGKLNSGFTTSAFDCSSLMQYIFYYGAGVLLDVTTRTQIMQGEEVAKEDIARGDLLFFTNTSRCNKTGIERVGHVALYLGDNYILHTSSDYAKIEQISAQRWNYFLEARRVL